MSEVLKKGQFIDSCTVIYPNKLLSPYQCGFRKKHSADVISRGVDQGMLMGAVFVDLHKAFDSVEHNILMALMISNLSGLQILFRYAPHYGIIMHTS